MVIAHCLRKLLGDEMANLSLRALSTTVVFPSRSHVSSLHRVPYPSSWERIRCCSSEHQQNQQERSSTGEPSTLNRLSFPGKWPSISIALSSVGFFLGPLLDGIHSNVQLLVYDDWAINIGSLKTNIVVPPLLGIFYGVVGLLQLVLDNLFAKGRLPKTDSKRLFLSFLFLVFILELSAEMYKSGTPYNIEAYALFGLAELNWYLFDRTWWGFGLAAVAGVCCPLAEVPLMKFFNLWHYPNANIVVFDEGLVTWILACYFSYIPFLANLSRWLDLQFRSEHVKARSD
ncbi:hypothetical protein KP509_07G038300 [Ceratopteris richardii]|uniref:Uncharacterized protein n=1 Tax=Ceratopteris richardii TaxID=49495 RepID=A0A8T2UA59_CERRI|nr:hypothetical protein KP509_07G038300 [Ceratopteris richardii]